MNCQRIESKLGQIIYAEASPEDASVGVEAAGSLYARMAASTMEEGLGEGPLLSLEPASWGWSGESFGLFLHIL
jgi:hypothetical protein